MEDILEVEYRIRATVYVLDELEKSYSEETNFKEKYLLSVFKGALSSIQSNVRETIHYIDVYSFGYGCWMLLAPVM